MKGMGRIEERKFFLYLLHAVLTDCVRIPFIPVEFFDLKADKRPNIRGVVKPGFCPGTEKPGFLLWAGACCKGWKIG